MLRSLFGAQSTSIPEACGSFLDQYSGNEVSFRGTSRNSLSTFGGEGRERRPYVSQESDQKLSEPEHDLTQHGLIFLSLNFSVYFLHRFGFGFLSAQRIPDHRESGGI